MPATYEPIASVSLSGNANDIEFTNIPGTYTDLILVTALRSNRSAPSTNDVPGLRFNGDTASNYSRTLLYGTGSTAGSARSSSASTIEATAATATSAASNLFGVGIYQIMSYANTNVNKTVLISNTDNVSELNRIVALWRSTSAITSLRIYPIYGTSFVSGSTASLFGVKAA